MHLPYGRPTYVQVDISTLVKVQHTAAWYALNDYSWRSSVTAMLNSLDWPTLESCHVYSKLVMFQRNNYSRLHEKLYVLYRLTFRTTMRSTEEKSLLFSLLKKLVISFIVITFHSYDTYTCTLALQG